MDCIFKITDAVKKIGFVIPVSYTHLLIKAAGKMKISVLTVGFAHD